ncbi:Alkaline phosphatase family protein [Plasmodiophora brassicae]|uniref:Alkaline phosphatase family protein n=1 Tax=Plasmodiophora brassicae TaxID=37360 RepID=A0A0G4J2F9_PLABS|nr:hypothetical protein PBRA_008672 [Plasmodiophora brassicae]
MPPFKSPVIVINVALLFAAASAAPLNVVMIGVDGCHPDWVTEAHTPNLVRLANQGIMGHMTPVFPTLTFPSQFSIVTGLYPDHHGIVANEFYDPKEHASWTYRNDNLAAEPRWWSGVPIWAVAKTQGLPTAVANWPTSRVQFQGTFPDHFVETFTPKYSAEQAARDTLRWIDQMREEKPDKPFLALMYIDEVDRVGHRPGPKSNEMAAVLERIDGVIGEVVQALEKRSLMDTTAILVVSDHGMTQLSDQRRAELGDLVDMALIERHFEYVSMVQIWPKDGCLEDVYRQLKAKQTDSTFRVYLKQDLPDRLRYKVNRRIAPIVVMSAPGFSILVPGVLKKWGGSVNEYGAHGYDNAYPEMTSLFIARIPGSKRAWMSNSHTDRQARLMPFDSVHVHNLLARLLGVAPAQPNDGTSALIDQVL